MIGICINSLLNCGLNYLIRVCRITLVFFSFFFFYGISFKILKILDYINFIIFHMMKYDKRRICLSSSMRNPSYCQTGEPLIKMFYSPEF